MLTLNSDIVGDDPSQETCMASANDNSLPAGLGSGAYRVTAYPSEVEWKGYPREGYKLAHEEARSLGVAEVMQYICDHLGQNTTMDACFGVAFLRHRRAGAPVASGGVADGAVPLVDSSAPGGDAHAAPASMPAGLVV